MKKIVFTLLISFLTFSVSNAELNLELPSNFTQAQKSQETGVQKRFYSTIEERRAGLRILRKLRRSGQMIEDPEINNWVRSVGNKLVTNSVNSTDPFYFLVSRKTSINAFATEGSVIVVHAGLILKSDSEAEVAAVLAHEIAHVTQRHIARMKNKAKLEKLGSSAALLAGAVASSKDSQAGSAIINTTLATMAHRQLSYSREAESEADREGLMVLSRAGYNPLAMPRVLGKLEQFGGSQFADIQEFLQNHPLTHKRVTDTLARAKRLGSFKQKRDDGSFLYIREKLRVLSGASLSSTNSLNLVLQNYRIAQNLSSKNHNQAALKLLNRNSGRLPEAILSGQLLNKTRQYQQTVTVLQPMNQRYPANKALMIPLANAYLALGQTDKAWSMIKDISLSEQTSLEFLETYQKVANAAGKSDFAYYLAAQKNIRTANYKAASLQLRQAIKRSSDVRLKSKMKKQLEIVNKSIRK